MCTLIESFDDELIQLMQAAQDYRHFVSSCRDRGIDPASLNLDQLGTLFTLVKKWHYHHLPSAA